MKAEQAKELLKRYRKGHCSAEENKAIESWIEQELSAFSWDKQELEKIRFGEMLKARIDAEKGRKDRSTWSWMRIAAAAVLLFCLGIGFYFYRSGLKKGLGERQLYAQQDVKPGGNKATLTLGNGQTINLSDAGSGEIAEQSGMKITKTRDGQLIYDLSGIDQGNQTTKSNKMAMYNTIATPKGGQYQVRLPDGSKVWLNAASSLKYLANFSAWNERRVELSGEAYFEVAKDKTHPFIVKTEHQEVKVLGTHFNINSYKDEPVTKTTLLEGSVRVAALDGHKRADVVLRPGEAAVLNSSSIQVLTQDAEDAMAWKEGYFMFNNESLESVMRKISRWYNVEVEFTDDSAKSHTFYGRMSRFSKVSQILKNLEMTKEVKFEIKDNKIYVLKN